MPGRKIARGKISSFLLTGIVILLMAAGIIALQLFGNANPQSSGQRMTLEPQIVNNLTQLPLATPLAGEAASHVNDLKALVEACPDYSPERRSQMEQHIQWLLNPAQIPGDMIIALGSNPTGKLIFGMATYTSAQWRIMDSPGDSCLVPIGRMLNDMLIAVGEDPDPVFAETP